MQDFHKYFHWFYYHKGKAALFNLGLGAFIWLFLTLTQPFGIYENNVSELLLVLFLMPIGLIWVFISFGFDWIGQRWMGIPLKENHRADWWMWVIKLAVAINLTFALRGNFCSWQCVDGMEYLQSWLAFLLMFSFFYLPYTFYAKYKFFHGMVGAAAVVSKEMTLVGETKEVLRQNPDSMVYFQSDDNYVVLWTHDEKTGMRKTYFRASLSSIENQLKDRSEFVRIHRSYIINSKYFGDYHKASKALSLKLAGQEVELPVSRKYKDQVATLFVRPR